MTVKLSPFYAGLPSFVARVADVGAAGVVVFNRFYQPDIDLDTLDVDRHLTPSTSAELPLRLHALALLHGRVELSLASTGGVHSGLDAAKAILCGASAVQIVSALARRRARCARTHPPRAVRLARRQGLPQRHRSSRRDGARQCRRPLRVGTPQLPAGPARLATTPTREMTMAGTKPNLWHGIPREDIPWYPKVDDEACIGCQLCYITCGRSVYEMGDGVAIAVDPMNCAVGCSTCGNICPTGAITFPPMDAVWKLERERQIFRTVKKEAARKHEREDVLKARAEAQRAVEQVTTRARVEIAGEFGDKQFLVRLEELIANEPYDVVNLRLEVPTVKGARQKAPSYMSFEVTSEEQQDVTTFLAEVKALVHDTGLVLVAETKL